jgi:hypothetical protein
VARFAARAPLSTLAVASSCDARARASRSVASGVALRGRGSLASFDVGSRDRLRAHRSRIRACCSRAHLSVIACAACASALSSHVARFRRMPCGIVRSLATCSLAAPPRRLLRFRTHAPHGARGRLRSKTFRPLLLLSRRERSRRVRLRSPAREDVSGGPGCFRLLAPCGARSRSRSRSRLGVFCSRSGACTLRCSRSSAC